jgi:hypothetical protein
MERISKTIIVVVNSSKRVTDMLLRHLETIVNPGDRIEFLIKYRHEIVPWFFAHVALMHTGLETAVACEERRTRDLWDMQKSHLERDVAAPARRIFSRVGVEVNVQIYSGPLSSVLKSCLKKGEIVVVVRASWRPGRIKIVPASMRDWFVFRGRKPRPILVVQGRDQFAER